MFRETNFLKASASVQAGALTGIKATALLCESKSKEQNVKYTVGPDAKTQLGYDAQAGAAKASVVGFGFLAGKEIGIISTPVFSVSWTPRAMPASY